MAGSVEDILPAVHSDQHAVNNARFSPYAAVGMLAVDLGPGPGHCTAFLIAPDTALVGCGPV